MPTDKITWKQFTFCNHNPQGLRYEFEDLCRQLFTYEFLSKNKIKCQVHCNPNNPGLESEPVYDEINNRLIGYQAKYFDNTVDYYQIEHSAKEIIKHYAGKVDHVYLFCNKAITATCKSYMKIVDMFEKSNITMELITDTTILDLARKYHNIGLYYFENYSLDSEWFNRHNDDIQSKLGNRYNSDFNIDTKCTLNLSLFVHDKHAINYINGKKKKLLLELDKLNWRHESFNLYKENLRRVVIDLSDVGEEDLFCAINWNQQVISAVKTELDEYEIVIGKLDEELDKISKEFEAQYLKANNPINEEEIILMENKISQIKRKKEQYKKLINLSKYLELTDKEKELIIAKILIVEGKAGVGKSHLLANEIDNLFSEDRNAIMLVGGDYLDNGPIMKQICLNMELNFSFDELLDILENIGELNNDVIPIFIDAINETWIKRVWKNAIPSIFNKIRNHKYIRLVMSYRSEYRKTLIEEKELNRNDVSIITHQGFAEESIEATRKFLNYYGIPFTPINMFNMAITNPLFLTLYCKTYQKDGIEFSNLYERLISVANEGVHKTLSTSLIDKGYNECDDVVMPVVLALADCIVKSGKRSFAKSEIVKLSIWGEMGINACPFIQCLVRENILHNNINGEDEIFYFSYDQMNDYYCAKSLLKRFSNKKLAKKYLMENMIFGEDKHHISYANIDMFIYACTLYAEKFGEECIDIIDHIEDDYDKKHIFSAYIDSYKWRKTDNITSKILLSMCNKYKANPDKVWEIFIANSTKINCSFNSDALHKLLLSYPLNKRDYMWTIYINGLESDSDNRFVQLIRMYNLGDMLETINKKQLELLVILMCWMFTASSRWLRDTTSKAVVEILKENFDLCEIILKKFEKVNDPYVIQRLYGVVWGSCVKRNMKDKKTFKDLAIYVYKNVFSKEKVYPDILLRDYARLIIERFLFEYPKEEKNFSKDIIKPPYNSDSISEIEKQEYDNKDYESGIYNIMHSMKFEGMGMYGDFGRYVFQAALRYFDVNHEEIFNYAVYYVINELGYNDRMFGYYDSNLGRRNYSRHNTAKLERIGKKYQWIAMYNILSRVSDHCKKEDIFSHDVDLQIYEGPWEPYVRDFDPSLNINFMKLDELPRLLLPENIYEYPNKKKSDKEWINEYSSFFDIQKSSLMLKDSNDKEWVILSRYADNKESRVSKENYQIWNWIYGYFVTSAQLDKIKCSVFNRINLLNDNVISIPQTYSVFSREFPWSPSSNEIRELEWKDFEIKTGEKKTIIETCEVPDFSEMKKAHDYKIKMKTETCTRTINEVQSLGEILCSSVNFSWEEEFDASKEETISWYAPCSEIIEDLHLQYGLCDGAFYDSDGVLASFDSRFLNQDIGILIRKDLLDQFLLDKDLHFIWFVKACKEVHSNAMMIENYRDWTGVLCYEKNKISGEIYKVDL